jgi:drug/metabolite transporter (DMT)-like permease
MCCSGLLVLPALLVLPPLWTDVPQLVLIGILIFAPAVLLYWEGVSRVGPVPAATIQLLEPVAATAAGVALGAAFPTAAQLVAAGLTVWAAWLEGSRRPT